MIFHSRSVTARATTLIALTNGESTNNGNERRSRFRKAMSPEGQHRPQTDLAAQLHPPGGSYQFHLLGQSVGLLLQTKCPRGALLQFLLRSVQCLHSSH